MDEWIKTPQQFDEMMPLEVQKNSTMEAFHTSQHVTGPPGRHPGRGEGGQGGGGGGRRRDQPISTACFLSRDPGTVRAARPTCGGSSTARERGTAANALYACLTFMGNSSGEVGEGARGCRGVVGGGGVTHSKMRNS